MNFKQDKLSVFQEINNIGAGNASTSLSQMLNKIVDIGLPKIDLIKFSDIKSSYTYQEELFVGTIFQISGDLEGFIMVVMNFDSAFNLLSMLLGIEMDWDIDNYEEVCKELGTFGEICNIICGTYLTAISNMTGITINQSTPYLSTKVMIDIINLTLPLYEDISDFLLCVETEFFTLNREIEGKYYFIPNMESFNKLLSKLGFDI